MCCSGWGLGVSGSVVCTGENVTSLLKIICITSSQKTCYSWSKTFWHVLWGGGAGLFQSCIDSYTESKSLMLSDSKGITESYYTTKIIEYIQLRM